MGAGVVSDKKPNMFTVWAKKRKAGSNPQSEDKRILSCCENSSLYLGATVIAGVALLSFGLLSIAACYNLNHFLLPPIHAFTVKVATLLTTDPFMIALLESALGTALLVGGASTACDYRAQKIAV